MRIIKYNCPNYDTGDRHVCQCLCRRCETGETGRDHRNKNTATFLLFKEENGGIVL